MKQPGFAFPKDDALQIQFEEGFGYELTPDQKEAVKEIKEDMEKPQTNGSFALWRCWFWQN